MKKYIFLSLFFLLSYLLPDAKAQPVFGTDAFSQSGAMLQSFSQPLLMGEWAEMYYLDIHPWERSLTYQPFNYAAQWQPFADNIITDPLFYLQSRDFLSMSLGGLLSASTDIETLIDEGTGTTDDPSTRNDVPLSDVGWLLILCGILYGAIVIVKKRKRIRKKNINI